MTQHCFIVTSAVNSKFGVFKPEERLSQTIDTIKSIKNKIPTAKIVIMECCGEPIREEQRLQLQEYCDCFIDYSVNEDVQALYDNDNWDVVKNGTEIMCFGRALNDLKEMNFFEENKIDRTHKMSGRYVLNDDFKASLYDDAQVQDKFVIGPKYKSQFPVDATHQPWQYMARLWSWPTKLLDDTIGIYENSLVFFAERLAAGGYVDIEHVLARFIPADRVVEVENLGVEGMIAPNGQPIKN